MKKSSSKIKISPVVTEIRAELDSSRKPLTDYGDMPVVPLRESVLLPMVSAPIELGRDSSIKLARYCDDKNITFALFAQKSPDTENPGIDDVYHVGVTATVLKVIDLPDGTTSMIINCHEPVRLESMHTGSEGFLRGKVEQLTENVPEPNDMEMHMALHQMNEAFEKLVKTYNEDEVREMRFSISNIENPILLLNFICFSIPFDVSVKQELLETLDLKERTIMLTTHLNRMAGLMAIREDLRERTRQDLSQQQREAFLRRQMDLIQDELNGGEDEDDVTAIEKRGREKKWPEKIAKHFAKELRKLDRFPPQSPDYALQYSYLETLVELPWNVYSKEQININKVQKKLDKDHYGLQKIKERIIEQMAVLQQRGDMKSPILCLYGPPGVGKTSLGKSIAEALGRDYARISLGGLHDEAEIRGHRKTYIGAMPGRITAAMLKLGTSNPVFVLDEIDKIGKDFKGDPSTALLEVLDPEQNDKFHDNYIDVDYDLSHVMFIATANDLSTISRPLLDRMEVIEISGYIVEEKLEIAKRHLIPKLLEEMGFKAKEIKFKPDAIRRLISAYTRESGVRQLEKKLARLLRIIAKRKVAGEEYPKDVTAKDVVSLLGAEEVHLDECETGDYTGVVTGLAWTQVGGEILEIESVKYPAKTPGLTLTGNLGDVMKESAQIAMKYLQSHADRYGIDPELFEKYSLHIHVPEGAIPKDGPSAGVTMVTSLASTLLDKQVKKRVAMTGEITLRGRVLPVGGIKEKILAAKRSGVKEVILCYQNEKNVQEIGDEYISGLTFHYVHDISEVLAIALGI